MSDELVAQLIVRVGETLAKEPAPAAPAAAFTARGVLDRLGVATTGDLDRTLMMDRPPVPEDGPRFGRYRVLGPIGSGGAGEVFDGFDPELHRVVAIKVLHAELRDRDVLERFVAEAQVTAQLEHPGVVPIHDFGVTPEGRLYYVMKRIRGLDLFKILGGIARNEAPVVREWTRHRRLTAFVQICRAVAYAHERGVVHRDLKPSNLMFGAFGEAMVLDWGLARVLENAVAAPVERHVSHHTRPGAAIGTVGYMSPEQSMGAHDHLGPPSDVWSLGVILYETLTIRRAFRGSFEEVARRIMQGSLTVDAFSAELVPAPLARVIEQATAVAMGERHPHAGALADAVDAYLEG